MADEGFSFGDFSSGLNTEGMFGGMGSGGGSDFSPRLNFDFGSATPNVGGGGFSFSDLMSKVGGGISDFGGFASKLLPFLGIGAAGLNTALGFKGAQQMGEQNKLATRASERQDRIAGEAEKVAQPLSDYSKQALADAQAGKVPAAIQSQIEQWGQAARQQVMDFAARTGQSESSQVQSWLSWIEQQKQGMAAKWIQEMIGSGISAGQAAGGVLGGASSASVRGGEQAGAQAQGIENLIGQANAALAKLNAGAS